MNWEKVVASLRQSSCDFFDKSCAMETPEAIRQYTTIALILSRLSLAFKQGLQDESYPNRSAEPSDDASVGDGETVDIQRP